jgi:phenylacetate-CoA ligase
MNRLFGLAAFTIATAALGEHNVQRYLREARRTRRMPSDELRQRQQQKLRRLLTWTATRNEFYADALKGALTAADPLLFLQGVPFLEKRALQTQASIIRTARFGGRTIDKSTGGSTGAPIRIVKDADGVAREIATTWAALETYGIRIGDRSARFWGTPLTASRRFRFRLTDLAMNRIRLSAFDLDEGDLRAYWQRCFRFQPVWMYGYASLIHLFAEWIEASGLDGRRLGMKAIVPTSEPLNEDQRTQIRRVFGAPVYDEYGCGEVGAIAYECTRHRLHVMTDNVVLEILDDAGRPAAPGEMGEVILTDLTNYAMPIIRYRLGDRAVAGSGCDCALGFPVLDRVLGRIHDVVYTPRGKRWHGEKIDYLMSQLFGERGGFRQYQVVQRSADSLTVRLVSDEPISRELERRIIEYVAERLDGMKAEVVRVETIERSASGKIRLVRNDWLPPEVQPHV